MTTAAFVVADGVDGEPRLIGDFADSHGFPTLMTLDVTSGFTVAA